MRALRVKPGSGEFCRVGVLGCEQHAEPMVLEVSEALAEPANFLTDSCFRPL
jgi:hypothetical protein